MVRKFVYGSPILTESVITETEIEAGAFPYGDIQTADGFSFRYVMDDEDIVYGLGENLRGINKRGYIYVSDNTDDMSHTEEKTSLYGTHNLIIVSGRETFGLFFDYPSTLTFDIGYTRADTMHVYCADANLNVYVIEGDTPYEITKQFRHAIGRSYIPPRFAFGYAQSRWGYETEEDFKEVARRYRELHIPLDMLYMDIDYMEDLKDFTIDQEKFPDFEAFVRGMKEQHVRMVPIIDAGVKIEPGYDVYDEGVENNYFCKNADGSDFSGAAWPGPVHYPDFMQEEARVWFGDKYKMLTDMGIDGFWNDMNEPSIWYSPESMEKAKQIARDFADGKAMQYMVLMALEHLSNNHDDYKRFYHLKDGVKVSHEQIHNLYGYYMTRTAGEAFTRIDPSRRFLMISRSSCVGMHRYGGIWTGDNKAWWSHLLLNIKQMPSLNMCGFMYAGADLGGFGENTTRELLLRFLALGVFTPLMRNHAVKGSREQECYQFENPEDFRSVIGVRYRLIPYLYSEYMKAALTDDMYFRPIGFDFPEDKRALRVEDQLMLGHEVMIAPVYEQNARGRYVYLPEEMMFVKFLPDGTISQEVLGAGDHYVDIALNEVPMFIRKDKAVPLAEQVEYVEAIDTSKLTMIGYDGAVYELYDDDGWTTEYDMEKYVKELKK